MKEHLDILVALIFFEFMSFNLRYPANARNNHEEGKVVLNFVVDKDGYISEVKILAAFNSECEEEGVRVVKSMP